MGAFHYTAITASGQQKKGVLEAESDKQARQLIRDKGLIPLKLRSTKPSKVTAATPTLNFFRQRKLSSKELALITRQFATLLAAGLPVEEALLAVSEQTDKQQTKGILLSVRSKVLEGHTLHAAMREHPEAYSDLFCATIAAGEKSGHLDKVLLRLAEYTEQQWNMQQKLKTALIYPVMIVLVALGIVSFLLAYVVPKMVSVYSHLNQTLPALTQVLIAISLFVKSYGLILVILIIMGLFFLRRLLKKKISLRTKSHYLLLRLPLIGHAIKTGDTARFSRTFAILSSAGVSVLEAMSIAGQLVTIIPIRAALQQAVSHVREGAAIHLALKQTHYFSPMSVHMIASGEAGGQLEPMLQRVAENQEEEITRLIEVSLALFEPAVILIMGVIVLFIVLAVLLPIFQLNQLAG